MIAVPFVWGVVMKLFVLNEEVVALEIALPSQQADSSLEALVTLAWHLRQRDSKRAVALAGQAQTLLIQSHVTDARSQRAAARLRLVLAEVRMMFGELDAAQSLSRSAIDMFETLGDGVGLGDAYLISFSIARYCGNREQAEEFLGLAGEHYRIAGDVLRMAICQAVRLTYSAFQDPVTTRIELERAFAPDEQRTADLTAWVAAAQANVSVLTDDPGNCLRRNLQSYYAALASGQIARALTSVNNASESFALLGDLDAALEWDEHALSLARRMGWPANIGVCLMQMGDDLRLSARPKEARACLKEALEQMSALAGSRNHDLALSNLAQLELDVGDYGQALAAATRLEQSVASSKEPDLLIKAARIGARALFRLDRVPEGIAKAEAAIALAVGHASAVGQIEILTDLAEMHAERDLGLSGAETTADTVLGYLNQALALAATIEGYRVTPDLLNQVARAHASRGDFQHAFEYSQAAFDASNVKNKADSQRRSLAMQIHGEVERVQAETEVHRQRALSLAEANATLEILGTIGREITANLDSSAVCDALHRHALELLDVSTFAVYLADYDKQSLVNVFGTDADKPLLQRSVALGDPTSDLARSARERQDLVIELKPGVAQTNRMAGSLETLSLLFAPLLLGERLLGVMTIQSTKPNAYGERERFIFGSLCAYGAIALDNAIAYAAAEAAQLRADQALNALRTAQAQLMNRNGE